MPAVWRLAERLRNVYVRRWAGSGEARVTIRNFDGNLRFFLDRSTHIGSAIYWHGHHSSAEVQVLGRFLRPDMVFVDVGANQGEFTVFAAKRLERGCVLAFEPCPPLFEQLLINIAINGFTNVSAFPMALADQEGSADLYVPASSNHGADVNEGLASLVAGPRRYPAATVPLHRLDAVVRDERLTRLDFMKVDVEGGELAVLRGAEESLARFQPTLMIELSEHNCRSAGMSASVIVEYLVQRGYELTAIQPDGSLSPIVLSALPSFANLICRPESGVSGRGSA